MAAMDDIGSEVGQIRRDLADLRADLGNLMGVVKDLGSEGGRMAYERMREQGDMVRGQVVEAGEQMGHYIEARPMTSVLIAFGTGFALGTLVGNRHYH